MSEDVRFDALELARLANPEIDDMRRMALMLADKEQAPIETGSVVETAVLCAFRTLSKGG